MKVCVVGAGAIGSHLAARLAAGGADVSVVARGAQLEAIRERGLLVRAADGELRCRPEASADPAALGKQDAVFVTTKVPAHAAVAPLLSPLLGPETPVAFVVNGIPWWYFDRHGGPSDGGRMAEVDPGDVVRDAVGVERAIGGVVYSACVVTAPGEVQVTNRSSKLILGEPSDQRTERAVALAAAFKAGGLACTVSDDIRRDVWAKLLNNLSNGPICLLTRQDLRTSFADPTVRAAAQAIALEAAAIAAALGRPIPGDPLHGVALSADLPHKPSILQDLELGRPMEFAALFEAPLRLAEQAGVKTPMLSLMVALARQAALPNRET